MKSRDFQKLDRALRHAPADPPRVTLRKTTITKQAWIRWRMQLGAGRREALKLWHSFREWADQEAKNPRPRVLTIESWQDWEREFRAFLDEMPRKPYPFLALVAQIEKRREQQAVIAQRKARNLERYKRRYARAGAQRMKSP